MTGRGIDQVLRHPSDPAIHESYLRSALEYVRLAEERNGSIPRRVEPSRIWGEALRVLEEVSPDARVVNLETAVTRSDDWSPKGINYRMSPENVDVVTAAKIDCCTLANNHVLDWGREGLIETVETLHAAGIATSGAGRNLAEAEAPATLSAGLESRILIFSFGIESSGIPADWAGGKDKAGVAYFADLSEQALERVIARVRAVKGPRDLVVVSIHWGSNWGYEISDAEINFAHALIERAGAALVHGHSSHHPKAIEVYQDRLILYGCGDLINDYEGISGYEPYRGELGFMYFPTVDGDSGRLMRLELVATRMQRFRLCLASANDALWLCSALDREGLRFGTWTEPSADQRIRVRWDGESRRA